MSVAALHKSLIARKAKRSASSKAWLQRHFADPYVQAANEQGLRSRAWFKLAFIEETIPLLKAGQHVLELGAAPGSWTQWIAKKLGTSGNIIACDRLPMDPIEHVTLLQGDFLEEAFLARLQKQTCQGGFDVVLSDMAPNLSGNKAIDQPRCLLLAEETFAFVQKVLKPGGSFLIKLFHGTGWSEFLQTVREKFRTCKVIKPPASQPRSREVYLVSIGYK